MEEEGGHRKNWRVVLVRQVVVSVAVGCVAAMAMGCAAANGRERRAFGSREADIRRKLSSAYEADQRTEALIVRYSPHKPPPKIEEEVTKGRAARASLLASAIAEFGGWPGWREVGPDASHAAWIIAQHDDADLGQQKRFYECLRKAVKEGDASAEDLAYLEDRVRVAESQPQRYGTQVRLEGGRCRLYPVDDIRRVNERRRELGMVPVEQYVRELQAFVERKRE